MILITDDDLLERLIQVEGPQFTATRSTTHPNSVEECRRQYADYLAETEAEPNPCREPNITLNMLGCGGIIYGLGGWNRYFVLSTGEVVFSAYHGRSDLQNAERAGFRIWR